MMRAKDLNHVLEPLRDARAEALKTAVDLHKKVDDARSSDDPIVRGAAMVHAHLCMVLHSELRVLEATITALERLAEVEP